MFPYSFSECLAFHEEMYIKSIVQTHIDSTCFSCFCAPRTMEGAKKAARFKHMSSLYFFRFVLFFKQLFLFRLAIMNRVGLYSS